MNDEFNLNDKKDLIEEFEFCLKHWKDRGFCSFGGKTQCSNCGSLYLLWKLIAGEILDGQCLTFQDRQEKLKNFKKIN